MTIDRLSHSTVDSFLTCGEKLRLTKIEKIPQTPMWASVGGSAVHRATECLDLADFGLEEDDATFTFEDAFEVEIAEQEARTGIPQSEWIRTGRASKDWPDKQGKDWWLFNGQAQVNGWRSFLERSPWQVMILPSGQPAVEVSFEAEIGGVPVLGYVDRVLEEVRRPEIRAVVDLKSGSREPKSPRQLGGYGLGLKRTLGLDITWGFYFMTRKMATSEPADLTRYHDGSLDHDYAKVWAAIQAEAFIPHPGDLCGVCGVRDYCREMGGVKADEVRQFKAPVYTAENASSTSEEN